MAVVVQSFPNEETPPLRDFQQIEVAGINRVGENPNVVVFGKVVIRNFDGDAQNASALLLRSGTANPIAPPAVLDRADVRIGGASSLEVSLIGWITNTADNEAISIACATFNGAAEHARLIVLEADSLT